MTTFMAMKCEHIKVEIVHSLNNNDLPIQKFHDTFEAFRNHLL